MKTALTIAGKRFQRRCRHTGRYQDYACQRSIRHERHNGSDGAEHHGSHRYNGIKSGVFGEQLDDIFTDIYPDAVKIGMVSSKELIVKIAEKLEEYDAANVVVDPVMVSTSGSKLLNDDAIETP